MKNRTLTILLLVVVVIFASCSKEENSISKQKASNSKDATFAAGNQGNTFPTVGTINTYSQGNSGNTTSNGNPGNTFAGTEDASCLIGRWIEAGPCPQGYHLMLEFNQNGTGVCEHLAVDLCTVETNMPTSFSWSVSGGLLNIQFNMGYTSCTPFSCPSQSIMIMWLGSNAKYLQKMQGK